MNLKHYMLIDGKVVATENIHEWGCWMEKKDRFLKRTEFPGRETVSTVFLGLDHAFGNSKLPVLFETMVFGGKEDQSCWRYTSEAAAREGHERVVIALTKARDRRLAANRLKRSKLPPKKGGRTRR